ncbi:hypothetical protein LDO26_06285 [Luteimonas sp. BDR2-5]|uniref:hypothetical protein n=1 Tax=Proluteimonas luteida TaxID=2878685 RepID=UPI001E5989B8|nr:hypothetical protein [Luteimonas sp. BDR2-5]MCD9027811.1 hypothetical protein [Luteimonas sp. BDR2-5]
MPYFKVMMSGRGIDLSSEGVAIIGFFATRLVRAPDLAAAEQQAKAEILSEWRPGGSYALANRGGVPAVTVEEAFPVGFVVGIFGRRPSGYTFYSHED